MPNTETTRIESVTAYAEVHVVNVHSRVDGIYVFVREVDAEAFTDAIPHDDYTLTVEPLMFGRGARELIAAEAASWGEDA